MKTISDYGIGGNFEILSRVLHFVAQQRQRLDVTVFKLSGRTQADAICYKDSKLSPTVDHSDSFSSVFRVPVQTSRPGQFNCHFTSLKLSGFRSHHGHPLATFMTSITDPYLIDDAQQAPLHVREADREMIV